MRTLVLNHPILAEKVKEASSYPYIELREFVAKLIESYSKIELVEKHADPGLSRALAGSVAHLLQEAGGPIVEAVSSGVETAAAKIICAAMCTRTKKLFEFKVLWGSSNQWVYYIARQMQEMMPGRQQIDVQDLQTKLRDKAAPAGNEDWEVKVKQFLPVQSAADDAAALSSVKGMLSVSKQMAASTLTPDVVESIYMPKFRLMARGEPAFAGIGSSRANRRFIALKMASSTMQLLGLSLASHSMAGLRSSSWRKAASSCRNAWPGSGDS